MGKLSNSDFCGDRRGTGSDCAEEILSWLWFRAYIARFPEGTWGIVARLGASSDFAGLGELNENLDAMA